MNDIERAIETLKMENELMQFDPMTGEIEPIELQNQDNQDLYNANLIAISALEKQLNGGWIPAWERSPQNNEHILLFLKDEKGKTAQVVGYLYHSDNENFKNLNGEFKSFDGDDLAPNFLNKECVVAWQPLPMPYKEVEDDRKMLPLQ